MRGPKGNYWANLEIMREFARFPEDNYFNENRAKI